MWTNTLTTVSDGELQLMIGGAAIEITLVSV